MHWTDKAIVLSSKKYGETSASVRLFSRTNGVYAGIVRGAHSKTNRGVLESGNIVNATWQARLPEHMGTFKCELLQAHAALIMQDAARLAALDSACSVLAASLPERHPYPKLYRMFQDFLSVIAKERSDCGNPDWIASSPTVPRNDENWPESYVKLELSLLAESGFGLDLSACAATGTTEDLIYVSPKSGRAVSREAGEPYKEKLLKLPNFLIGNHPQEKLCESPPRIGERGGEGEKGGREWVEDYRKPNKYGSHSLIPNARELRKNMSDAEKQLWYYLRAHRFDNYRFRRQHPITPYYIADFICLDKKLVIELDGGQHAEQTSYDMKRTEALELEGYKVLRFWNNEVLGNMEGVLTSILSVLATPSPTLPPNGGGSRAEEILAGLRLTGYFLDSWLLSPHNRKLPAARERLLEIIKKLHEDFSNRNST